MELSKIKEIYDDDLIVDLLVDIAQAAKDLIPEHGLEISKELSLALSKFHNHHLTTKKKI